MNFLAESAVLYFSCIDSQLQTSEWEYYYDTDSEWVWVSETEGQTQSLLHCHYFTYWSCEGMIAAYFSIWHIFTSFIWTACVVCKFYS